MMATTIPKFFFSSWFWLTVMAVLLAIHYFWGKTPSPPRPSEFLVKHKKTIAKLTDIFIISLVLLSCLLMMIFPISSILTALSGPPHIRTESLHSALAFLFTNMIVFSGTSAFFIGFLSTFQSNLTKAKRTILVIISLTPTAFTIALLISFPENSWSTIKLGLQASLACWVINGPAILTGKHFSRVSWALACKLRLVSGDYQG